MAAPAPGLVPRDSNRVATIKYLYFMRFSLILWLVFPALEALDLTGASAITRGIVALETGWHLFFAAFFVVMAGWVALLSARIVCAYGEERFGSAPPTWWGVTKEMSVWTFLGAQVPGFTLLGYVWYRTATQQGATVELGHGSIVVFLGLGALAALGCWILMAQIYYWLFWAGAGSAREAKAFVIPFAGRFDKLKARQPSAPLLGLLQLFERAARLGPGFADPERGEFKVHSGHSLAFLTLSFLATVYLAFWDYTAPVELENVRRAVRTIFVLGALIWVALTLWAKVRFHKAFNWGDALRMVGLFSPMLLAVSLPFAWDNDPKAMPVLGFVTVLVTFVLWGLAGLAFLLDRFRVPVLTLLAILFFLSNLLPATGEHYLRSSEFKDGAKLRTPGEIFEDFQKPAQGGHPRPVIIVTATGGGIHAAAWTSAVLTKVENEVNLDAGRFHDSVLLMSTVSGGSVGTVPWLTDYISGTGFGSKTARDIAECSDLQAVAWGLTYADFLRGLDPLRFSRLGKALNTYDRGWALEQAFRRNRETGCGTLRSVQFDANASEQTVGDMLKSQRMPAFTLNTTAEESGSRFIVGNYEVRPENGEAGIMPADSLLARLKSDVPLSTAARLSANFPFVSPMARVEPPADGFHFGDGGYFDNDGTASAIEFLWFALKPRPATAQPVPVLILEIRDGDDPKGRDQAPEKKAWGPLDQGIAPLETFYNANHKSVTRRNRRELFFMEQALLAKASFTHIVAPFETPKCKGDDDEPQALSWHLTKKQKDGITQSLACVKDVVDRVTSWYANQQRGASGAKGL